MITKRIKYICKDYHLIENYKLAIDDDTQIWQVHHRLEETGLSKEDLLKQGLYWNRPPEELIFLTIHEHRQLHTIGDKNPMFGVPINLGKHHSDETKERIRIGNLKCKNFLGKQHTTQTKSKMRNSALGRYRVYEDSNHTKWHWSTTKI